MVKQVSYIIFVILSALLCAYIFRMPIVQWAVAPQLDKAGVELSCLDFSLSKKLDLHINQACLRYNNQQLIVKNVTVNSQKITINNAFLTINKASNEEPTNSNAQPLNLALPKTRPLLVINELHVNSDFLKQPIKLSINENKLNQLHVDGDVKANVYLADNAITAELQITDSHLKRFTTIDEKLVQGLVFNTQPILRFNGVTATLQGSLSARYNAILTPCELLFNSVGTLAAHYNVNTQGIDLDISQLTNKVTIAPECKQQFTGNNYTEFAFEQLPKQWQVQFSPTIALRNNILTLGKLTLSSEDKNNISVSDIQLDIADPLASNNLEFNALLSNEKHDTVSITGGIENSQLTGSYQLKSASLPAFMPVAVTNLNLQGNVALSLLTPYKEGNKGEATISFENADFSPINVSNYKGTLAFSMHSNNDIVLQLSNDIATLSYEDYSFNEIHNNTSLKSNLAPGELFAEITASTQIHNIYSPQLTLNNINITSQGLQSRALKASHYGVVSGIEFAATQHISATENSFDVILPQQNTVKLNALLGQFEPLASFTEGEFSGRISGDALLQHAQGNVEVTQVSALYNDYLLSQLSTTLFARYNSGQLNVEPTKFTVSEFRAGAVLTNLLGQVKVIDNNMSIEHLTGEVFSGDFKVDNFSINKPQQISHVVFNSIDMSEVASLDDKSGISITGKVKGVLPIHFNEQGVEIIAGNLSNQGAGKLLITDNEAFDAVMSQQQELQPVLSLLTNLDIETINSSVALKPDGWLNLGVKLQGYNEAQQQQVNFNYNHEENIFTLLRALRLSDEITQKVEQQYSKKEMNDE
ncbi:YdbH domain-containing protein [Pseudoalteromonas sp. MMG010]|uniref:YdbH domain-containing protein n=1 Tax=Pseudoalteromonas sp. MMG010 TaxID=2822685 RepID=UPI001B3A0E8D|nr:YdbH domain-containing protein [Pseudoalteromonas sp. MMG010]MBQ4832187.1 YdbH domain-containing protein [Pseudoalteromonas sp. MMG010]